MTSPVDRITAVLAAELDEHGCEDDDEKRWQVARHWAERVAAELQLTEFRSVLFGGTQTYWATPPIFEPWPAVEGNP